MSTSLQVESHLEEMRAALKDALQTVYDYQKFGSICAGWDGS